MNHKTSDYMMGYAQKSLVWNPIETLKLEIFQFLPYSRKALPAWKLRDRSSGLTLEIVRQQG